MASKKKTGLDNDLKLIFLPYPDRDELYKVSGQVFASKAQALDHSAATGEEIEILTNPNKKN